MADIMNRIETVGLPPVKEKKKKPTSLIDIPTAPMSTEASLANQGDGKADKVRAAVQDPDIKEWFNKQRTSIETKFGNKEKEVERKRLVEMLAHAMTQFGGAMQGQKTGVDMSGLKFLKTDFEKQLDRLSKSKASESIQASKTFSELMADRKTRRQEGAKKEESQLDRDAKRKAVEAQVAKDGEPKLMKSGPDIIEISRNKDGTYNHKTIVKARSLDIREQSLAHRVQEGDEPSDKQTGEIGAYNEALTMLDKIKEIKTTKGIDTGPVAAKLNTAARFFGIDDPDVSTLRQDLMETLAKKIQAISGAAASEQEADRLKATLPNFEDNDEQFMAKLENAVLNLSLAKGLRLDSFEAGGRDIQKFREGSKKAPDSGFTMMKSPDGDTLKVPNDQVESALKAGATKEGK